MQKIMLLLHWASYHVHIEVVKLLLAAGAEVHAENDLALRYASAKGHTKVVKLLLDAGADVHAKNDEPLRSASLNGHTKIVKLLLAAGADVHADNDAALRWASNNGHPEVLKILLDVGADVHAHDDHPLRLASKNGHTEVLKLLKQHMGLKESFKVLKEMSSLDFERGQDPKTSMGIGKYRKYKGKTAEEIAGIILRDLSDEIHSMIQKLDEIAKKKGYESIDAYQESLWDEEKYEHLTDKEDPDIELFIKNMFDEIEEIIINKYPIKKPWRGEGKINPVEKYRWNHYRCGIKRSSASYSNSTD